MGITKKQLRQIIKEEVLKELQQLDEASLASVGTQGAGGGYISQARRIQMAKDEYERIMQQHRKSQYDQEEPAHIRKLRAADERAAMTKEARRKEAQILLRQGRDLLLDLSKLNKKGWLTRNTPIGGNWREQQQEILTKLKEINEEAQRLLGKRPSVKDRKFSRMGTYEQNGKAFVVYALPDTLPLPKSGISGTESISFDELLTVVKYGNSSI
jgi:hypothetical protein